MLMSYSNDENKERTCSGDAVPIIDIDDSGLALLSPLLTCPLAAPLYSEDRRTGLDRRVEDRRSRAREFSGME
jgi:hypothetical protein